MLTIGDARAGSTKRVAAAVGEGAQVIATVLAFRRGPRSGPSVDVGRRHTDKPSLNFA